MRKKVVALLPAYNARRTLRRVVENLPRGVFDEIFLGDDCSTDGTFEYAKKMRGIRVYKTPRNLGYGGNLKYGLTLALSQGAHVVVEIHPDGEYGTDGIVPALAEIRKGAVLVLGNRFSSRNGSLPSGMITTKFWVTRFLSRVYNSVLGTDIPDMHQGFRVYTKTLLTAANWRATHDNFLFSFEIICQAMYRRLPIASVPVTARYQGKKRGASWRHSIVYTLGTFPVLVRVIMARLGLQNQLFDQFRNPAPCPTCRTPALVEHVFAKDDFALFDCHICGNGFTHPVPRDLTWYYRTSYWRESGVLGGIREAVFFAAQRRRVGWLRGFVKGGRVCDVGSGAGRLTKDLRAAGFEVTNIDPYYEGPSEFVKRVNFLSLKGQSYDAVTFWESLEHVGDPAQYLRKAHMLLRPGGLLFVEYPRYGGFESRVFGKSWFHLDIPRHLVHFRDQGLARLVHESGFRVVRQRGVFAFEYAPMGMLMSVLRVCGIERYWRFALPLLAVTIPVSMICYLTGASSIGLLVAKKEHTIHF